MSVKPPNYTGFGAEFCVMTRWSATLTLVIATLLSNPISLSAQGNWDVGLSAGVANYMGDIGDGAGNARNSIWDLQEMRSRPALGVFARRKLDQDGLWHVRFD